MYGWWYARYDHTYTLIGKWSKRNCNTSSPWESTRFLSQTFQQERLATFISRCDIFHFSQTYLMTSTEQRMRSVLPICLIPISKHRLRLRDWFGTLYSQERHYVDFWNIRRRRHLVFFRNVTLLEWMNLRRDNGQGVRLWMKSMEPNNVWKILNNKWTHFGVISAGITHAYSSNAHLFLTIKPVSQYDTSLSSLFSLCRFVIIIYCCV